VIKAKLMAALNECTEWGQVFIMDCLSKYEPDAKEASDIIERVSPRLKHANPAVSLAAVRVIMKYLPLLRNPELQQQIITSKLPAPLITLVVSPQPEIVFVALRNINIIVQMKPDLLSEHVRSFFVKYNDPTYVKLEKLEILVMLTNLKNIDQVLLEFKQYASEADVSFVRKSVRAIGRVAIKLDRTTERCIKVLLSLMEEKKETTHVLQEGVIVIKDIFRKYPTRYDAIIPVLCEKLEAFTEPEALGSMIWILGEYADNIQNAPQLLTAFVESFEEESSSVQLQLLTAVVKLFLKRPNDAKALVTNVLNLATKVKDDPDLRDRGYVYWRLLIADPVAAQAVVLAERPPISDAENNLSASLLDALVGNLSTLASISHKVPRRGDNKKVVFRKQGYREGSDAESASDEEPADEATENSKAAEVKATPSRTSTQANQAQAPPPTQTQANMFDITDLFGTAPTSPSAPPVNVRPANVIRTANAGPDRLKISSYYERTNGAPTLYFIVENNNSIPLTNLAIRMDDNVLGIANVGKLTFPELAPGQSQTIAVPLAASKNQVDKNARSLCIAFKTNFSSTDIFYTQDVSLPPHILFEENGTLPTQAFLKQWQAIPDSGEVSGQVVNRRYSSVDEIKSRLTSNNIFFIAARRTEKRGDCLYFSLSMRNAPVLLEISLLNDQCIAAVRSSVRLSAELCLTGIQTVLTT
jgi:AP-1 complex subunit beta-1